MKTLLEDLLPRFFPGLQFACIAHEGKQDLERSIPRKLQSWQEPGVRFVIMSDNDNADCRDLKARLANLCVQGGRSDSTAQAKRAARIGMRWNGHACAVHSRS